MERNHGHGVRRWRALVVVAALVGSMIGGVGPAAADDLVAAPVISWTSASSIDLPEAAARGISWTAARGISWTSAARGISWTSGISWTAAAVICSSVASRSPGLRVRASAAAADNTLSSGVMAVPPRRQRRSRTP